MSNLAEILATTVEQHGDQIAVELDDIKLNYAVVDQASARAAGLLRAAGIGPGDRVGIMLPNVPYFPFVFFGAMRLGAVVVPMNPLLKEREVAFHLDNSGARTIIAWHQFEEAATSGAADANAEVILVEPGKFEERLGGAELTHGNLRAAAEIAVDLVDADESSVTLGALPLFHVFGLTSGLNSAVQAGGTITLLPRFSPTKALEIVQRDGVTTLLGVPTMYAAMLHEEGAEAYDTSGLDLCVSGGAAMPVEILRAFEEKFACTILEGYGLSETCGIASFNRPDRERKAGSIGIPVPGVDMKVVDDDGNEVAQGEVGEILIRGPVVMKGYWERPDATAETLSDGWMRTGDMARVDEEGYFFIVDRKKEMIIRGGFNIYPRELEEVLYEHPAVREAAVVGLPDESLGEEVGAAVALKAGESVEPSELRAYMKERVAAYKYPRVVWIVDDLPKGPTGKILKREVEIPAEVEQR